MYIKKLLPFILALSVISCSNSNIEEEENTAKPTNKMTQTTHTEVKNTSRQITTKQVNKKIEKKHIFSDPKKQDTFQLILSGKSVIDADLNFNIISSAGKTIYSQKLKSIDLIGFGPDPSNVKPLTKKQQEDFIIKRMDNFFAEKNFYKPAIQKNDKLDTYFLTAQTWNELKADKSSIGFYYLVGKEDGRKIAYHKKSGKVILYLNCC